MKAAALVGLAMLAGLPVAAQAVQPSVCKNWDRRWVDPKELARIDVRCEYKTRISEDGRVFVWLVSPPTRVRAVSEEEMTLIMAEIDRRSAKPARPAVSPEMLELMRLDLERRQMELDRMERMRRERANRELGMFMLRQAFRPPVYVPPPPQPTPQDRHTQYLLQEYLRNELARQRREKLLGPYN